jgi:TorA maturation chaperone TorD
MSIINTITIKKAKVYKMDEISILKARAVYYNLFARFFVYTKDVTHYFELLNILKVLKENPLDEISLKAIESILEQLDDTSNVKLLQEYDEIFNNPASKNIRVTASFYDEGVESGKKRVEMLQFLAKTKIRRNEKEFCEYEDSVGFIFTLMAELIELVIHKENEYKNTAHCIFTQIINEFIDEFAKEVYEHKHAHIFKNVMVLLHSFIEFERLYLEVSKPTTKERINKEEIKDKHLSQEEKERRAKNKALKALGPKV